MISQKNTLEKLPINEEIGARDLDVDKMDLSIFITIRNLIFKI